jgi:hypothetical protein
MHNSITKLLDKLRWRSAGSRGVMVECPDCRAENFADEWYCNRCGAELPALQNQPPPPLPLKQGKRGPVLDIENYPLSASPAGRRTEAAAARAAVHRDFLGGAAYVVGGILGLAGVVTLFLVLIEALGHTWVLVVVFLAGGAYSAWAAAPVLAKRTAAWEATLERARRGPKESDLSPADLWDKKVFEGMDPDAATAYVYRVKGGGAVD